MNTGRAVLLKGVADVLARMAGLLTFPIIARYADVDGYGAFSQMNIIVGFLIPFASLGLGSAMVRFFVGPEWSAPVRRRALRVGGTVLISGVFASSIIAVSASTLNDLFLRWPQGAELFRWGSLLIAIGAVEFWLLDLMRARTWLVSFSAFQITQTMLGVAAVVLLLPNGYSLVDLVIATAALRGMGTILAFLVVVLRAPIAARQGSPDEVPAFKAMVRFGLPLTVAGLGLWMMNLSDRLVIGYFMNADALGLYGSAYTVATLLLVITAALFLPAYPRLMASVAEEDANRLVFEVGMFHRYLVLAVVPGAVFLGVVMHSVLLILGGPSFDIDRLVAVLIVAGLFVNQWNGLAHYILPCFDRTVFLQNAWIACGLLNVGLNCLVVPAWGLRGAAAVTLISFLILDTIVFVAAGKHVNLRRAYRFGTTLRAGLAAVAGCAAAVAILAALEHDILATGLASIGFWGVYLLVITLFRELGRDDVSVVLGALGVRSRRPVQG